MRIVLLILLPPLCMLAALCVRVAILSGESTASAATRDVKARSRERILDR